VGRREGKGGENTTEENRRHERTLEGMRKESMRGK
jgi:hypothetical protein